MLQEESLHSYDVESSNADKANCQACVPIGVIGFVESTLPQEETMDRQTGM